MTAQSPELTERWHRIKSALGRGHRLQPDDKEWLFAAARKGIELQKAAQNVSAAGEPEGGWPYVQEPSGEREVCPDCGEPYNDRIGHMRASDEEACPRKPSPASSGEGDVDKLVNGLGIADLLAKRCREAAEALKRLRLEYAAAVREGINAVAEIKAERDMWKANHDEMVKRNRVLRDRPDLPADRLPALEALIAERDALRDERNHLRDDNNIMAVQIKRLEEALKCLMAVSSHTCWGEPAGLKEAQEAASAALSLSKPTTRASTGET